MGGDLVVGFNCPYLENLPALRKRKKRGYDPPRLNIIIKQGQVSSQCVMAMSLALNFSLPLYSRALSKIIVWHCLKAYAGTAKPRQSLVLFLSMIIPWQGFVLAHVRQSSGSVPAWYPRLYTPLGRPAAYPPARRRARRGVRLRLSRGDKPGHAPHVSHANLWCEGE